VNDLFEFLGLLFFVLLFITAALAFPLAMGQMEWQSDIVKHGCATWEVADDGTTTFKWREK
jgi:hypothetical protein